MYNSRYALLKKAYARFMKKQPEDFASFCEKEAEWLEDYALFMALKDAHGGIAWFEWEKELKTREQKALSEAKETYADDILFYKMLQYLFFKQWWALKEYVNEKGIEIIGDVPIYVAGDSADVWANPAQFYLDENLDPIDVAGCPPDAFSADGQLWGNPLFRWDEMKKTVIAGGQNGSKQCQNYMILYVSIISVDLILTMRFLEQTTRHVMVSGERVLEWICFMHWRRSLAS